MITGRALHFVFKVADRTLTAKFYRDVLGMKVLRHEEFSEGCEAACNGPYANRWSKTMIGYGPEDTHFVVELTYNYGITHYDQGNDFIGITVQSSESLRRAAANNWPVKVENGVKYLEAPGGYKFYIIDKPQPVDKDRTQRIPWTPSPSNTIFECRVLSRHHATLYYDKGHFYLVKRYIRYLRPKMPRCCKKARKSRRDISTDSSSSSHTSRTSRSSEKDRRKRHKRHRKGSPTLDRHQHPAYDEITTALQNVTEPHTTVVMNNPFSFLYILPYDLRRYFTYRGSLTTPPCSEVVIWLDFEQPIRLAHDQIRRRMLQ